MIINIKMAAKLPTIDGATYVMANRCGGPHWCFAHIAKSVYDGKLYAGFDVAGCVPKPLTDAMLKTHLFSEEPLEFKLELPAEPPIAYSEVGDSKGNEIKVDVAVKPGTGETFHMNYSPEGGVESIDLVAPNGTARPVWTP